MGIAYRIDTALGCTIEVWDGDISDFEQASHILRLAADTEWPPGPRHLTDLTTVAAVTLPDPTLVEALIEGTNVKDRVEKVIVVRPDFPLESLDDIGAARGGTPTPFTNLDDACAHLNLSTASVRATINELRLEIRRRSPK